MKITNFYKKMLNIVSFIKKKMLNIVSILL